MPPASTEGRQAARDGSGSRPVAAVPAATTRAQPTPRRGRRWATAKLDHTQFRWNKWIGITRPRGTCGPPAAPPEPAAPGGTSGPQQPHCWRSESRLEEGAAAAGRTVHFAGARRRAAGGRAGPAGCSRCRGLAGAHALHARAAPLIVARRIVNAISTCCARHAPTASRISPLYYIPAMAIRTYVRNSACTRFKPRIEAILVYSTRPLYSYYKLLYYSYNSNNSCDTIRLCMQQLRGVLIPAAEPPYENAKLSTKNKFLFFIF
jgi:hypothetical protein